MFSYVLKALILSHRSRNMWIHSTRLPTLIENSARYLNYAMNLTDIS